MLFNGRWSTQWAKLQQAHYKSIKKTLQKGTQWAKQLLLIIWKFWDSLWKCRNEAVHGGTKVEQNTIMRTCLLQELKDIYDDQSNYVPSDCQYLMSSYDDHSKKSYSSISSWLAFHRPIFKNSRVLAEQRALQRTRPISTYYPPTKSHQGPRPPRKYRFIPHPAVQRKPMFPCNRTTRRLDHILKLTSRTSSSHKPAKENSSKLPQNPARHYKQTTILPTNINSLPTG